MDLGKKENNTEVLYTVHSPTPTTEDISEKKEKKSFFHIDKSMIRYKLHFFLFEGALGIASPFISIFAKDRVGLSATAFATIITTQTFLFIFTKPLIGYFADYFNKLKVIIFILTLTQGTVLFLLLPIQRIKSVEEVVRQRLFFESAGRMNLQLERCGLDKYDEIRLMEDKSSYRRIDDVICTRQTTIIPKIPEQCILYSKAANSSTSIQGTFYLNSFKVPLQSNATYGQHNAHASFIHEELSSIDSVCKNCCDLGEGCYALLCPQTSNSSNSTPHQDSQFIAPEFWLFAAVTTITSACVNALFTLSDTALCESVQKSGADFGQQRLWGAVGFGVMSPIGGLLNDYFDDYLVSWIVMGILTTLTLLNLYKIEIAKPQFSKNIWKDVGTVFRSAEFMAFEVGVLLNGIAVGITWSYLLWFLTTIGGSRFLCGLVQTVQCFAGELPFMFYSGWIIKKVGHTNVISLALLGYFSRFLWYSFLEDPWLVLPIEVLQGLTYGLFYPNVALFAKKSAKPGTEATTQSILFTTHEGLGAGLGCVLAGVGFDCLGGHRTFFNSQSVYWLRNAHQYHLHALQS